jgi:hypothetical protein
MIEVNWKENGSGKLIAKVEAIQDYSPQATAASHSANALILRFQ